MGSRAKNTNQAAMPRNALPSKTLSARLNSFVAGVATGTANIQHR